MDLPREPGERRLFFANAKLVDAIVDGDARQRWRRTKARAGAIPAS
jgi:hypothetical protein